MTTNHAPEITSRNDLVPTSSRPRPAAGTTSPNRPRPSSPTLSGDEVDLSRRSHTPNNTPHLVPGTRSARPLITDRNRPFFQHLRDLLVDGDWHHRDQVFAIGKTHGLADRTIANLLPRASKRRWISRSRGHIQIHDRAAFEAALKDGAR